MGDHWQTWGDLDKHDPYIDWWWRVERPLAERGGVEFDMVSVLGDVRFSFTRTLQSAAFTSDSVSSALMRQAGTDEAGGMNDTNIRKPSDFELPIPSYAKRPNDMEDRGNFANPDQYAQLPPPDALHGPQDDGSAGLPDDTIIVGVIDTDIPLGHARFRDAEGKSRILAAWQMLAPWGGPDGLEQPHIPFGRELYKRDIDALLLEHSGGSLDGWLDEQAFNTATGVLDMRNVGGRRGIASRASHGAHVMDIAAGCDPLTDTEFARRVKIVAINIPDSSNFGAPGTFLDEYLRYAILRVADLADALWLRNNPNDSKKPFGYPVVLNISFGKQAGAKSNLDKLPAFIEQLRKARKVEGNSPIHISMPAGNDNHLQCNAFLEPRGGQHCELGWRILPEDRSSNFVEIWFESKKGDNAKKRAEAPPARISLVPPGADRRDYVPVAGKPGQFTRLGNIAAIYCERVSQPGGKAPHLLRYVLCVAPTYVQAEGAAAPSGTWTILLHNETDQAIQCRLSVQTDQQISAGSANNLRSYFEDPAYRRYDEEGRLVDSECYPGDKAGKIKTDLIGQSPVRRHGTMNSSASNKAVARVGGYRLTDGKPAFYSATGRGRTNGEDDGTSGYAPMNGSSGAPTVALPTDDGPAHFGILAAGSANGSTVAMRGTSFASALAARWIVHYLMSGKEAGHSAKAILANLAKRFDNSSRSLPFAHTYPGKADIDQAGWGRLPPPVQARVGRSGFEP